MLDSDPSAWIRSYYDSHTEEEWERLQANPRNKVNFHLHRWYLEQHITAGQHVLEVGAGPGRFTIELARLGARITVGDISPAQLAANALKVSEAQCEQQIVARVELNVLDLSQFPDQHFDSVVCYGGPLSYVFKHVDIALGELLRVTKPGGLVFISVMSLLGSMRRFLAKTVRLAQERGLESIQRVYETGDQYGELTSALGHYCHMFRWSELEALLGRHPCSIVAASSANFLAVLNDETLAAIEHDPALWQAFLQWEVAACCEPGALDGGTHIIVIIRRS